MRSGYLTGATLKAAIKVRDLENNKKDDRDSEERDLNPIENHGSTPGEGMNNANQNEKGENDDNKQLNALMCKNQSQPYFIEI